MNQSEKPLTNRCTRIEVELEKTDQHNFPEFSFLSLKNELEKATETEGTADVKDADECAKIAAMLEAKYSNFGNTAKFDAKKRRRHERIEDFMDMGEGYDQEDDFIDDSEAHEIFVPQQYDTWHGGFYVNQGLLRLKMADTADEEVTMTAGTKMRNFGKAVSDSDESDSDKSDVENSAVDQKDENKIKKSEKQKNDDALAAKKTGPGRPPKNGDAKGISAKIVKNGPEAKGTPGRPPKSPSKTLPETKIQEQAAQLPETELPEHIRTKCNTLRQIAEASKGMSSQKFFSASVLDLLVEIDNHIKDVSPKIRNATLEFVSEPMPCKKDTLMLRLKKMRKDKVESVLKEPFDKFTAMIKKCVEIQTIKYEGQLESFNKRLAEYTEKSKTDPSMKKPRQPSKNFNWTSDAKTDLFELLKLKESLYPSQKPKDTTLEAWIKEFVNVEIKGLFPPGWVTYEKLEKMISIEKNKREIEKNSPATNGTPKLEKKVGEKRKLVDSPVNVAQPKTKTTQPAKIAKQNSPELQNAPVCNSMAPVSLSQSHQSLSVEQQMIAQKVIQLAMEKQRRELEENLAKDNEAKNKKAQEQRMQKLMKLVASQNIQSTPANKPTKQAVKTPKKSPKELKEQLLKGVSAQSQLVQKTPQKSLISPSKSFVNNIASQNSTKFPSSSSIYQITSSPTKTVIKSSPVKNTPVFLQETKSASSQLQSATRRLSSENMVLYPGASHQYISPVTLQHQNHKSPSSSSFSINNLVSHSPKTSQSYILSQSQNNHQQVQSDPISSKASNIQGNGQQFLIPSQAVHQNIIQNPLTAQNQVRMQQTGQQAGYRYIETSNGIFLGQVTPNQGISNDPLSSIEPTLPIDPFFHSPTISRDKVSR